MTVHWNIKGHFSGTLKLDRYGKNDISGKLDRYGKDDIY